MRKQLAIATAKLTKGVITLSGRGGTTLPGLLAERIDKNIVAKITRNNFPAGIVVVTGTNGKTTTTKLIAEILSGSGISVVRNGAGSNLRRGIITTILSESNLRGHSKAQVAILEVDEAYIPSLLLDLKPNVVVVTNLFRDQLDRYGELDDLADKFRETFKKLSSKTQYVLNADDPLVRSLEIEKSKTIFFGVSDYPGPFLEHDTAADSIYLEEDNKKLNYLQRYFAHIGIYSSKISKYSRPNPQINLVKMYKNTENNSIFDVKIATNIQKIEIGLPGLYNAYNCLASIAVATSFPNITLESIGKILHNSKPAFGRAEQIVYRDTRLRMMLVKNPTGFNQVIQTFLLQKPQVKTLLIVINDEIADGRDVSWLWDTAIEDLTGYKGNIICSGSRAYDIALRLKYADIATQVIPSATEALEAAVSLPGSKQDGLYILPTYTAMLSLRKHISGSSDIQSISQLGEAK